VWSSTFLLLDSGAIDEWIRSYLAAGLTTLRSASTNDNNAGAPTMRARSGSLNALSTIQTLQRRQQELQSNQQQLHEIMIAAAAKNNLQASGQAASLGSAASGTTLLLKQGPTQRPEVPPFAHVPHHQAFLIPQTSSNAGLQKFATAQLLSSSTIPLPSAAQKQTASKRGTVEAFKATAFNRTGLLLIQLTMGRSHPLLPRHSNASA
jgi:hypothetical protein